MRILENRDEFRDPRYRLLAQTLRQEVRNVYPRWIAERIGPNGFSAGFFMHRLATAFDAVVTVGPRPTLVYGLLSRVMKKRPCVHVVRELYLTSTELHGWHRRLYRFAMRSVDLLIVNSSGERQTYSNLLGFDRSKIVFIPWPTNISDPDPGHHPESYYLAAGRSLRDWHSLARAVDGLPRRFVVICEEKDAASVDWPENVEIRSNVAHDDYVDAVRQAEGVIVPLMVTERSTGQATILEAMALGRPVVATDVLGSRDYIEDGVTGFLHEPGRPERLRANLLRLIQSRELREEIGANAYEAVVNRFNARVYVDEYVSVLEGLVSGRRSEVGPAVS